MGAENSVEGQGAPMTPLDEHPSPIYRATASPWDPYISEEQEYITYANDDYGFSLDFPATWVEKEEVDTEDQFKVSFSAGKYGTILVEVRNILESTGGKPATLKAWRKFNLAQFKDDKNVTLLKEDRNAYLGPLPAFELLLETRTKKSVSKNRILSCVNASGSLAYAVTVASDQKLWGTFLPMFNGSLNSFSMDHRALDPNLFDEDIDEDSEDEEEVVEPKKKPNKDGKNARFATPSMEPVRKSRQSLGVPSDAVQFNNRKSISMVSDSVAIDESSVPRAAPRNKSTELQQRAQYRRSYASGKNWYIYYNDQFNFRCEYSPTWDKKVAATSVTFSAGDDSFATIVVEVKDILAGNKGKPMNLDAWRKFNLKQFSSQPNIKIDEQSDDVNLSLLPGFDLVLLVKTRDYMVKNKVRSAVSPDGKLAYVVTMATRADWFPEFRPVIDKFLYNFHIDLDPEGAAGVPESERSTPSPAEMDEPAAARRPPRLSGASDSKRRSPPKGAMGAMGEIGAAAASRGANRIGSGRMETENATPAPKPSSSRHEGGSGGKSNRQPSGRGEEKREERRNMRSRRRHKESGDETTAAPAPTPSSRHESPTRRPPQQPTSQHHAPPPAAGSTISAGAMMRGGMRGRGRGAPPGRAGAPPGRRGPPPGNVYQGSVRGPPRRPGRGRGRGGPGMRGRGPPGRSRGPPRY